MNTFASGWCHQCFLIILKALHILMTITTMMVTWHLAIAAWLEGVARDWWILDPLIASKIFKRWLNGIFSPFLFCCSKSVLMFNWQNWKFCPHILSDRGYSSAVRPLLLTFFSVWVFQSCFARLFKTFELDCSFYTLADWDSVFFSHCNWFDGKLTLDRTCNWPNWLRLVLAEIFSFYVSLSFTAAHCCQTGGQLQIVFDFSL